MMSRISPLLLATLTATACAGRDLLPDERVLHVRELVAVTAEGDALAVLEVVEADGEAPRATLARWTDGGRTILRTATAEEARLAATLAGRGRSPADAWPDGLAATLPAEGWRVPGPPAAGPPWHPPGLPGWTLERRQGDDPRYGPTTRLLLRDRSGRTDEVARFAGRAPPSLELRFLADGRLAVTVRPQAAPGVVVADVVVLDPGPAAGRLLAGEAGRIAAAGDPGAARELLAAARRLAPREPTVPYREAVLAAAAGDREGALAALAAAIALDPSLYRMRARTDPAFAPLRGDAAFHELVRPRPLD